MKVLLHHRASVIAFQLALLIWAIPLAAAAASVPESPLTSLTNGDRVLIVAPHPDDESLCCAGAIARAHAAGARVAIVWLTMGDAFELDAGLVGHTLLPVPRATRALGGRRMLEAREAARILGVPRAETFFLGYPDRGLAPMMAGNYALPFTSRYTKASTVWYADALSPGAEYEGRNLERDLRAVMNSFSPTVILAPSPFDRHPDHATAGGLALKVATEHGEAGRVAFWLVHGGAGWPTPRGLHASLALTPPARLAALPWQSVPLSADARDLKLRAIRAHMTQTEIMRPFLLAFVRANEIFVAPVASAAKAD